MVLGRLAVDEREQRRGLGSALLKDAFMRIICAAEIAGLRAVLVHALDDEAKAFYKRFGFRDCPTGERQLMMPIQDIRATMAAAGTGGS
jgi:predicted N-acetyltransferase YhbS